MIALPFFRPARLHVYTDGAIRPDEGVSGLGVIVKDDSGTIKYWWGTRAEKMTCNEAEYAAVILALVSLRSLRPLEVHVYSDSQILVHQMRGIASVRAPALRQAHARVRGLTVQFDRVCFHHIPRTHNRLADALANDVADGR